MNYKELLGILMKKDSAAVQEIVQKCYKVKENWNKELHNTKEIASKVLELLGPAWEQRIENAVLEYYKKDIEKFQNNFGVDINKTPSSIKHQYKLPTHGSERTKILKYAINSVLEQIYEKDQDFKYLKKHNPVPRKNVYTIWKDSKFKKRAAQSPNNQHDNSTSQNQENNNKYSLQVSVGKLIYFDIYDYIINNNIKEYLNKEEDVKNDLINGELFKVIEWQASLDTDVSIQISMGFRLANIEETKYEQYYVVSVDEEYIVGDVTIFDLAFTIFKNQIIMHTKKYCGTEPGQNTKAKNDSNEIVHVQNQLIKTTVKYIIQKLLNDGHLKGGGYFTNLENILTRSLSIFSSTMETTYTDKVDEIRFRELLTHIQTAINEPDMYFVGNWCEAFEKQRYLHDEEWVDECIEEEKENDEKYMKKLKKLGFKDLE